MTGSKVLKIIGWVFLGLLLAGTLGLALGFGLMLLWNWLMPDLFGLPEIGYWQAVGLFVLCHLLFKGHHHHGHSDKKDGPPWSRKDKRHPFAKKIHKLVGNGCCSQDEDAVESTPPVEAEPEPENA